MIPPMRNPQVRIVKESSVSTFVEKVQEYMEMGYMAKHFNSFETKFSGMTPVITYICILESLT